MTMSDLVLNLNLNKTEGARNKIKFPSATQPKVQVTQQQAKTPPEKIKTSSQQAKTIQQQQQQQHTITHKHSEIVKQQVKTRQPQINFLQEQTKSLKSNNIASITPILIKRLNDPELCKTFLGSLVFLEDTQVRDRAGKRSSEYDATDVGDGAKSRTFINIPVINETISVPFWPKIRNKVGEWSNDIHGYAQVLGHNGKAFLSAPDSNMFLTAITSYPLYLLKDNSKNKDINKMRKLAMENIEIYKRGPAYTFWPELPSKEGLPSRVGPPNLFIPVFEAMVNINNNPIGKAIWKAIQTLMGDTSTDTPPILDNWLKRIANSKENPYGGEAFFYVPNDADDTAMAMANKWLYSKFQSHKPVTDVSPLNRIEEFRDCNRKKEDGRDAWKGKDTGAYLTWLRDENKPAFSDPEEGIIPLDVNNVDTVVNANVLLARSLYGLKSSTCYKSAVELLVKAIKENKWSEAHLYYPQYMMFPYTVSRAYRDGEVNDPKLKDALKTLLIDILNIQEEFGNKNPEDKGAFPGKLDYYNDLSTALGVTALLNFGKELVAEAGVEARYDKGIAEGLKYLLKRKKEYDIRNPETLDTVGVSVLSKLNGANKKCQKGVVWESGMVGSGSYPGFSQWRSRAYTTAVAMEAITKYFLGYDLDNTSIKDGRKLVVSESGLSI